MSCFSKQPSEGAHVGGGEALSAPSPALAATKMVEENVFSDDDGSEEDEYEDDEQIPKKIELERMMYYCLGLKALNPLTALQLAIFSGNYKFVAKGTHYNTRTKKHEPLYTVSFKLAFVLDNDGQPVWTGPVHLLRKHLYFDALIDKLEGDAVKKAMVTAAEVQK